MVFSDDRHTTAIADEREDKMANIQAREGYLEGDKQVVRRLYNLQTALDTLAFTVGIFGEHLRYFRIVAFERGVFPAVAGISSKGRH